MKKPDPNDKKYTYWHKGAFKKIFNNQLFLEDCNKYEKSKQGIIEPIGMLITEPEN